MKKRTLILLFVLVVVATGTLFATGARETAGPKKYDVALSVVWEGNTYAVQSREEFYAEVERQKAAGTINVSIKRNTSYPSDNTILYNGGNGG
jgi:hypothetical protein